MTRKRFVRERKQYNRWRRESRVLFGRLGSRHVFSTAARIRELKRSRWHFDRFYTYEPLK